MLDSVCSYATELRRSKFGVDGFRVFHGKCFLVVLIIDRRYGSLKCDMIGANGFRHDIATSFTYDEIWTVRVMI